MFWFLLGLVVICVLYAFVTQYKYTTPSDTFLKRVAAAIGLAAAAAGAAFMDFLHAHNFFN